MAKRCSSAALLLLAICLLCCPLLAFAVMSRPEATSSSSTQTSSIHPSNATQTLRRSRLTLNQSEALQNDPSNAFLPQDATHRVLDYSTPEGAAEAEGTLWAIFRLDELQLRQRIHEATVDGWGSLTNFTALASGLGLIDRLDELHWLNNDPIPAAVLNVLENTHPSCKLFYDMEFSNWDRYDRTVSPTQLVGDEPHRDVRAKTRNLILGSRNLYSLTTHVGYGADPDPVSLRLVHQILTTCPNLRRLDLSVSHGGCVISDNQPFAFDLSGRSKLARAPFPPLVSLRLSGYHLDGPYQGEFWPPSFTRVDRFQLKWPWHYLPAIVLEMLPPPWLYFMETEYVPEPYNYTCFTVFNQTLNVDGWIERMNFSKLNSLDVTYPSSTTLHKLRPLLTNLTSLTVRGGDNCAVAEVEVVLSNSSQPLSHLHLSNVEFSDFDNLLQILDSQHGIRLRSFALHEHEQLREHSCWRREDENHSNCTTEDRPRGSWYDNHLYLNNSQIQKLQQSSPAIETLNIDMDRNLDAAAQAELFDSLGSFMNLSKLTLRLESPSFQAFRNASCTDRWDWRLARSGRQGALEDPLVNTEWVREIFRSVRSAQASRMADYGLDTPVKLKKLELILGPWSSRHENSMMGPDLFVLGRFECNALSGLDALDILGKGDGMDCTGQPRWPDEYMWDYESDLSFMDYEQDHLDEL